MNYGFYRVACASPELKVCDCSFNSEKIVDAVRQADSEGCSLVVFPELSVTGYTCGDLFLQTELQRAAVNALEFIARKTASTSAVILVGLPVSVDSAIYNCAAVIQKGKVLAVIPQTFIPN